MKVSNNKIGGTVTKPETGKTGKVDSVSVFKKDATPTGAASVKGPRDGSKVDVSERAQMMQKAKDIASESSIDEGKVARLQKMVDEGTYKVDADKIADRLVDEHMLVPDSFD